MGGTVEKYLKTKEAVKKGILKNVHHSILLSG
jgi:hypothetical protein